MNLSNIFNKSNYIAFIKTAKETNLSTLFYRSITTLKDALLYPHWYQKQLPDTAALEKQQSTLFSYTPIISIVVPTYCTPIPFLHEMIQSVINQTYSNWELCIADASPADSEVRPILTDYCQKDTRIKVQFLSENKGISGNTNHALKMTTGEFIGLLDHDDLLAPNALFEIVSALNRHPDIDVLYTDEDKIDMDSKTHYYPNFKPDYNPFLLRSCNYICHFFVFKRSIYEKVGQFDSSYDGSQDYNYILRTTRVANHIYHIPKMLYHWRVHSGSVASDPGQKSYCYDAAKRALQENLDALGINGTTEHSRLIGFYQTDYQSPVATSVSIFTAEQDFHFDTIPEYTVDIYRFSSINDLNKKIQSANSEYCIILNHGIHSLQKAEIQQLISYLAIDKVSAVTPRLIYNSKLLCLGTTYSKKRFIGCYSGIPATDVGFYGRAILDQNVPFCSADAFACKRSSLADFIRTTNCTTLQDLAILFSLHIYNRKEMIVGTAKISLSVTEKISFEPSKELLANNKKELRKAIRLYSVPKY